MADFTAGLDLGKSNDPSVLVVAERFVAEDPERIVGRKLGKPIYETNDAYNVVFARRWALGTPFTAVVQEVGKILRGPVLNDCVTLLYDATGVGAAVGEMFREEYLRNRMGTRRPEGIILHGGSESTAGSLSKIDLASRLEVLFQTRRLHITPELPVREQLVKELRSFTAKFTRTGRVQFENERDSDHDDLVIALGLACMDISPWGAQRYRTADGRFHGAASA